MSTSEPDVTAEQPSVEECGSFGCILPKGHNMGRADVPENHSTEQSVEALVERVRDGINSDMSDRPRYGPKPPERRNQAYAALDSLTAALERAERERMPLPAEVVPSGWIGTVGEYIKHLEARAQKAEAELEEMRNMTPLPDWQRKFRDCAKMRDEALEKLERAEAVVEAARPFLRVVDERVGLLDDEVSDRYDDLDAALTAYDTPPDVV